MMHHNIQKNASCIMLSDFQSQYLNVINEGNNFIQKSQQKAVNPYTCPPSTLTSHVLIPHAVSHIILKLTHCFLHRIRHLPYMPPFGTCTQLKRILIVSNLYIISINVKVLPCVKQYISSIIDAYKIV